MNLTIEKGKPSDLEELARLYDDVNDYLEGGTNHAGWKKGIYPVRETAAAGIAEGTLYTARQFGRIVGTLILNHKPEEAYHGVKWGAELPYSKVIVVHTFVVHPLHMKSGVGASLLDFAVQYSVEQGMACIRLDVYKGNRPAIRLYEKMGYSYVDTVDLGLGHYGLHEFRVYEKML